MAMGRQVVVTGATGNVGSSLVRRLSEDPAVTSVVALARRAPGVHIEKVSWHSVDVTTSELTAWFAGADAVIHLAWLIQPSHDEATTWQANVVGTARVCEAVIAASVPTLIVASSVGAYSPGPSSKLVDESWPTHGVATSSYSRQKAYVERLLDGFQAAHPGVRVVRLRPALIFQAKAATEIRRYFIGPFLPSGLLDPGRLPVFPVIPGLVTQVVHADDVAEAYRLALEHPVSGAFNVAADPPLDMAAMAELVGGRHLRLPAKVARVAAATTWHLRLQPTSPDWLDLAQASPLMDSARIRRELGWEPSHTAESTFREFLGGMARGDGAATAPLRPDSLNDRVDELRTGVGQRSS